MKMQSDVYDDLDLDGFDPDAPQYHPPPFSLGPPVKEVNYVVIERAAALNCTKEEIAALLGICRKRAMPQC
jgi:hypothetical protein